MPESLLGKSIHEIEAAVTNHGGTKIHAHEVSKWLYKRDIHSFKAIDSIPLSVRKELDTHFTVGGYKPISISESSDQTKKYLFKNGNGQMFEAVYMPDSKRNTLCISTQSGCRMGCSFCMTGKIGFTGNLLALDIVNQLYSIPERRMVNRIVIMGMGEPFDNLIEVEKAVTIFKSQWGFALGASSITMSTVGIKDHLVEFLKNPFCNLAISLHNPFSDERKLIMPIENSNPINEVVDILKENPFKKPLRLSFEYVALGGINLSEKHAKGIADLLNGLKYHLNIICWNSHEGSDYKSPDEVELKSFIDCLDKYGVLSTIRRSRGQDIDAACGQMAGKAK